MIPAMAAPASAAGETALRDGVSHRFRHLLGMEPLSAAQIAFLLDQSKPFQEIQRHPLKKLATLRGKSVALAFFEPSTRTRISFATAASRLGADSMNLQAESSSLKKGESLLDTVHTLDEAGLHRDATQQFGRRGFHRAPFGNSRYQRG